jgi:hypothetical protein
MLSGEAKVGEAQVFLVTYVDELLIISNYGARMQEVKCELKIETQGS